MNGSGTNCQLICTVTSGFFWLLTILITGAAYEFGGYTKHEPWQFLVPQLIIAVPVIWGLWKLTEDFNSCWPLLWLIPTCMFIAFACGGLYIENIISPPGK